MLLGGINLLLDNKKDQIVFENKIRTPKPIYFWKFSDSEKIFKPWPRPRPPAPAPAPAPAAAPEEVFVSPARRSERWANRLFCKVWRVADNAFRYHYVL